MEKNCSKFEVALKYSRVTFSLKKCFWEKFLCFNDVILINLDHFCHFIILEISKVVTSHLFNIKNEFFSHGILSCKPTFSSQKSIDLKICRKVHFCVFCILFRFAIYVFHISYKYININSRYLYIYIYIYIRVRFAVDVLIRKEGKESKVPPFFSSFFIHSFLQRDYVIGI